MMKSFDSKEALSGNHNDHHMKKAMEERMKEHNQRMQLNQMIAKLFNKIQRHAKGDSEEENVPTLKGPI